MPDQERVIRGWIDIVVLVVIVTFLGGAALSAWGWGWVSRVGGWIATAGLVGLIVVCVYGLWWAEPPPANRE